MSRHCCRGTGHVLLQDITTLEQRTATALYCKYGTTCLSSGCHSQGLTIGVLFDLGGSDGSGWYAQHVLPSNDTKLGWLRQSEPLLSKCLVLNSTWQLVAAYKSSCLVLEAAAADNDPSHTIRLGSDVGWVKQGLPRLGMCMAALHTTWLLGVTKLPHAEVRACPLCA
jgi:hypothetical protein